MDVKTFTSKPDMFNDAEYYQYEHLQRDIQIKEWLRYNIHSSFIVYKIFCSRNPNYPDYTDFIMNKEDYL